MGSGFASPRRFGADSARRRKVRKLLKQLALMSSVLLPAAAAVAVTADADVVVRLRNGRSMRGTVVEQDTRTLKFRVTARFSL